MLLYKTFLNHLKKKLEEILAEGEMGHKELYGTTSIIMLGLIALSKCLSLSLTTLGYFLYNDYVTWRKRQ